MFTNSDFSPVTAAATAIRSSRLRGLMLLGAALVAVSGCGERAATRAGPRAGDQVSFLSVLAPSGSVELLNVGTYGMREAIGSAQATRRCQVGQSQCVVTVSCPPSAAGCLIPDINRSCAAGQRCVFVVPRS